MTTTEAVDITSDTESDSKDSDDFEKPIIQFLQKVIVSKSQTKTLLTDAKIWDILQKELDIDKSNLHALEEMIYLYVMKNCLQNWPDWNNFAKHLDTFEKLSDAEKKTILSSSYKSLKLYLLDIYKSVVPLSKAAVQDIIEEESNDMQDSTPNPSVVLNICATKAQLQKLIFRQPNPQLGDTIFNVSSAAPPKIKIVSLSMQSILNWCGVKLYIMSPTAHPKVYIYKRETKHEYKHVLVNKKLKVRPTPPEKLNQALQVQNGKGNTVKSAKYIEVFKKIGKIYSTVIDNVNEILDFVTIEMLMLPTNIYPKRNYRRYTNKYPYIHYLYEDVENVSSDVAEVYDLQLEETLKPAYEFYLGNTDIDFTNKQLETKLFEGVLVIECTSCQASFKGKGIINEVKVHFALNHTHEADYKCANCAKEFTVDNLTNNWWSHEC